MVLIARPPFESESQRYRSAKARGRRSNNRISNAVYDFIVVGAGIAGLACAELLQRSGRAVLLIEAEEKICSQASAQQQGWFHTGALYAALPSGTFFRQLVGNLDDLLNYYSAFPGMNLASGRQLLTTDEDGWFRNRTNYYFYVSPSDPSLKAWQKPLWSLAILRAKTRLSWFETVDFTRELSPQIHSFNFSANLKRCVSTRRFDFRPGAVGTVLKSRDRTFDAARVTRDLLNSFLAHGGALRTGRPVTKIEHRRVHTGGEVFETWNTVVTAGSAVQALTKVPATIVQSPLLVVKPAFVDANFVWMTMNIADTFNHLFHEAEGGSYSLIGNASYYDRREAVDEAAIKARLVEKAERVFSRPIAADKASLYFGVKTELAGNGGLRNYQYHIVETDDCVVALPGKMSLAFSLAINVCRHFGIDPVVNVGPLADHGADAHIGELEHRRRFAALP